MKFNETNYDDPENFKNLIIIDSLNLAFRWKHSGAKNWAAAYINTIKSLANSYEANKIILTGDGGSYYRKNIYPEYKANRQILRDQQTEEEEELFKEFLKELDKVYEIVGENLLVLRYKGIEADDIAAYITKYYSKYFSHTWLISSDKDWDLLIKSNVSRFSYVTRKEITKTNWSDHYIYETGNHIDIKCLQGDKGDNIPGVVGIGDKRAYALIKQYGSAFDIYDAIPLPGKQVFIQNLNKFKDGILLNYELMDLLTYCEEAINTDIEEIKFNIEEYIEND